MIWSWWKKTFGVWGPPGLNERDWRMVSPRVLFASSDPAVWEGRCRRMTFNAYVGDETVLCRTLARFKMYVSTRDEGLGPHLIGEGYWELWITRFISQVVKPGMVCIDAGANIGYYSVLLADLAYPSGKVIAAEPVPTTLKLLDRNVAINGFWDIVTVLRAAFGAEKGEVSVYVPPGEPKNAMILHGAGPEGWSEVRSPIVRIDDLDLPSVDFVKIDVEGAEVDVWAGMQNTVAANRDIQIVMEVNCNRYRETACEFLTLIEEIFPLRCINDRGEAVPITRDEVLSARYDVMLYLRRT